MESGSFKLKVDGSEAKNDDAGVEAVAGDFLRQCSLGGDADAVSFLVGDYKFHVHQRAVLAAASPVFKDMLLGAPTAAAAPPTDGIIRVDGVEPETFRALLRFVYAAGELPGDDEIASSSTSEMLRSLVAAADTFGMERLKLACDRKLSSELVSVETVVATLGFAETHNCRKLRNKCLDFLMEEDNLCRAAVSEGYAQLILSFPSVVDGLRARLLFPGLASSACVDYFYSF